MKKLLALILAASMCLSFAACGEEEAPATTTQQAPATEKAPEVPDGILETTVANIDADGNVEFAATYEEFAAANIGEKTSLDITIGEEKYSGALFLEGYDDAPGLIFVWYNEAEGVVEYVFTGDNDFTTEIHPSLKVGAKVLIERTPTMN